MQFTKRIVKCRHCGKNEFTDLPRNDIGKECVEKLDKRFPKTLRSFRYKVFDKVMVKNETNTL